MRIEIPELKRCCCCLPLRRGLIVTVYLQLFLLAIPCFILSVCDFDTYGEHTSRQRVIFHNVLTAAAIVVSSLEVAFSILFLIGAHRKNPNYMRIYYRFSIGTFVFSVFSLLGYTGFVIYLFTRSFFFVLLLRYLVEILCFQLIIIALQAYIVILVRSEVLKLENNSKFEFINHTSEPICSGEFIV